VQRDSLASYIGHPTMLQYMSIGLGQPRERTRIQMIERMIRPVGPPPEVSELCVWKEEEGDGVWERGVIGVWANANCATAKGLGT
jgi:hypothetical protein